MRVESRLDMPPTILNRVRELRIDREGDLRVELPPGVGLPVPDQTPTKRETLDRIEKG